MAMSYSIPVVAFEGGSIGDILENDHNGLVVERGAAQLAAAAARLLSDRELSVRLGEAGRETVRTTFSADGMVEGTARIYERLAGTR